MERQNSRSSPSALWTCCFGPPLEFDDLKPQAGANGTYVDPRKTNAVPLTDLKLRASSNSTSTATNSLQSRGSSGDSKTPRSVLDNAASTRNTKDPLKDHPKYRKVDDIATGASGFVQLAANKATNQQVAIKFVERGSSSIKLVIREVLNQRLCFMHPHVVQFYELFLTSEYLAIVTEFAAGGDLADYIDRHKASHRGKSLSEDQARWLFQQLITGLDFCHQMGIANRDIKLENTLLSDRSAWPVLKLCDFGYSKDEYMESVCKTMCGTPEYVAPEVLLYNRYEGKSADIWSCGVMLYVMLTGAFPFRRKEDEGLNTTRLLQRMFPRIIKADYLRPKNISPECLDLLEKMLDVDPEERVTVGDIMQHPWYLQNLPAKMGHLNKDLLESPAEPTADGVYCQQSEEEILKITSKAALPSAKSKGQ